MLGKKKQKARRPRGHFDTLISGKTRVEGSIHFAGGLHVDGRVQGSIIADEQAEGALIRLSECGEVEGDIIAPNIIINGTVRGDVFALEHLELASKAAITGNVYYNLVEMAAGASVNGSMVHSKDPSTVPHPKRLGAPETEEPDRPVDTDLPGDSPGEPGAISMGETKSAGGGSKE
ncbi:MAG: bactofilin family protein [Marinobacter sp.]